MNNSNNIVYSSSCLFRVTLTSAGESFILLASPNLDRAWIYCNLDPAWVQLGSSLDPAWIQPGSSLDLAWLQLGSSLDPAWIQLGHNMDSCWMQLGSSLDPAWEAKIQPGPSLDPTWAKLSHVGVYIASKRARKRKHQKYAKLSSRLSESAIFERSGPPS